MDSPVSDDASNRSEESVRQYVIQRDLEPTAITEELLQRQIRLQGPAGEAARLCRGVAIDFSTLTTLSLELLNILKIDHLWMFASLERLSLKCNKIEKIENLDNMKRLRELNLSFNCIECIENLEQLEQLEDLSLFRNKIRKIENVDSLKRLVRLSIGNNAIDSLEGFERLRFMPDLHSLNLEGNPVSASLPGDADLRQFVVAHLPQLKYYHYTIIESSERQVAQRAFKYECQTFSIRFSHQRIFTEMSCVCWRNSNARKSPKMWRRTKKPKNGRNTREHL